MDDANERVSTNEALERFQKENERLLTEYVARLESERLFEGNQTNGLVVPGTNDVAYVSNYDAKDFAGSKGGDNQSDEDNNDDANIDQASLGESSQCSPPAASLHQN